MSKVKLNSGLVAAIALATLFASWEFALIALVLVLVFIELDEKVKAIITKVITFTVGLLLFTMLWKLIVNGVDVLFNSITGLLDVLNGYLDDPISYAKLNQYLIYPIKGIVSIADNIVNYLITFTKFGFIIAVLTNKGLKENFVVAKINEKVTSVVNFINNTDAK
jgi:hypothetical protein